MKYTSKSRAANPYLNPNKIFRAGFFRVITNPIRTLPDFLIIGAPKCGTTSLYDYVVQHPNIFPAKEKEVQFFNSQTNVCYRAFFPTIFTKVYQKCIKKQNFITGESTPHYLYSDIAPSRVLKLIPETKLIIILRNPIDRAYSHYNFHVKYRKLKLSFEECVESELNILQNKEDEITNLSTNEKIHSGVYPYLEEGIYVDPIKKWMGLFPKKQFLILELEMLENPNLVLNKVFEFLNVPKNETNELEKKNVGVYSKMNSETRELLLQFYKPRNEQLYKFLGKHFGWDR